VALMAGLADVGVSGGILESKAEINDLDASLGGEKWTHFKEFGRTGFRKAGFGLKAEIQNIPKYLIPNVSYK